jgi:hypothetical protein
MGFNPFVGIFRTLSKEKTELTDDYYASIRSGNFFKEVK